MGAKNSHSGLLRGIVSDTHTPARPRALCQPAGVARYPGKCALARALLFDLTGGPAALSSLNFAVQDFCMAGGSFCFQNPTLKIGRLAGTIGACLPGPHWARGGGVAFWGVRAPGQWVL